MRAREQARESQEKLARPVLEKVLELAFRTGAR
jgi:hypothetical protein